MSDSNPSRIRRRQLVVYMDHRLADALDTFCADSKLTRSRVIREAIRRMLRPPGLCLSGCQCLSCVRDEDCP